MSSARFSHLDGLSDDGGTSPAETIVSASMVPTALVSADDPRSTSSIIRKLDGAGVSEVVQRLGKPTSSVHEHLHTLKQQEHSIEEGEILYQRVFSG